MTDKKPAIGTTEAAVRSCVSLMAAVLGQSEELLAYWMDLYYQVRCAYEREARKDGPEPLRGEDVYVRIREMFRAELAEARGRMISAPTDAGTGNTSSTASGPPSPQGEGRGTTGEGKAGTTRGRKPGPWTIRKREISERLKIARDTGVTVAQIVKASGGKVSDAAVMTAIAAGKLDQKSWLAIDLALINIGVTADTSSTAGGPPSPQGEGNGGARAEAGGRTVSAPTGSIATP